MVESDTSPKHKRKSMEFEGSVGNGLNKKLLAKPRNESIEDDSKIVIDTQSILDIIMAENSEEESSEEDEGLKMILKSSPGRGLTGKPPIPPSARPLENGSSSPVRKSPFQSGGTKMEPENRSNKFDIQTTEVRLRKSKSPAETTEPISRNLKKDTQSESLAQKIHRNVDEESEIAPFRMRGRSNAIDIKSSPTMKSKAVSARERSDSIILEDSTRAEKSNQDKATPLSRAERRPSKKDMRRSATIEDRTGSLSRKRMSGEQALGIFYHSRRSQFLDAADLEDAERRVGERGSSTDRSDTSGPLSPRSRDSRSFSPKPMSPLISKGMNFDHVEKERTAEVPSTCKITATAATSGGATAAANDSEEPESPTEMNPFQKALLAKKQQGRVALKTKKMLAMMEEETVIDDPHAKVKLLKHTKLQVRLTPPPACVSILSDL